MNAMENKKADLAAAPIPKESSLFFFMERLICFIEKTSTVFPTHMNGIMIRRALDAAPNR